MASQEQINRALASHPGFQGSIGSDQLPDWTMATAPAIFSFVVNMSKRDDPDGGTHWLAVWGDHGTGYWFDSYGGGPDADDRILGKVTHFRPWLNRIFGANWTHNTIDLQAYGPSDVCGEWSVMAVRIGSLPTKQGPPGTPWYTLQFYQSGKPKDAVERDRTVFAMAGLRKVHLRGMVD